MSIGTLYMEYFWFLHRHEESKIRKAYFRLAQKYHPDKNPEGRVCYRTIAALYKESGAIWDPDII